MKYRPEIDGLRAVAVLPVILFHAGFSQFSGGFVGVDVFFVISGYLITSIIYPEISAGNFSIARFYERRARRILPALFLVCLACVMFTYLWMTGRESADFFESLIAASLFVSNIYFWWETDYYSTATALIPLIHTWSLAIEEQFYVFFPILLISMRSLTKSSIIIIFTFIVLISLAVAEYGSHYYPTANFYLYPSRSWELGVGALLALTMNGRRLRFGVVPRIGSLLGIGLITLAIFTFDETTRFPSVWTLIPVVGAALVIAFSGCNEVVGRTLSWKPIVGVGLISYSAYLWHQPLFAFARIRSLNEPTVELYLVLIAATFALAFLSWKFVESPFRSNRFMTRRTMKRWLVPVSVVMIATGLFGASGLPFSRRSAPPIVEEGSLTACDYERFSDALSDNDCVIRQDNELEIVLWGDSHARTFGSAIKEFAAQNNYDFTEFAFDGCMPTQHVKNTYHKCISCPEENKHVINYSRPGIVYIISARYAWYLTGSMFNNEEGGEERGDPVSFECYSDQCVDEVDSSQKLIDSFYLDINEITESGASVILIGQIPEVGWHVPQRLEKLRRIGIDPIIRTSKVVQNRRNQKTIEMIRLLDPIKNVVVIDPMKYFCDKTIDGNCYAVLNEEILYLDDDHLSNKGVDLLMPEIKARLFEIRKSIKGSVYVKN